MSTQWSDVEVKARNVAINKLQEEICQRARWSAEGNHGLTIFDRLTELYLAAYDAGYRAALEDGAKMAYEGVPECNCNGLHIHRSETSRAIRKLGQAGRLPAKG